MIRRSFSIFVGLCALALSSMYILPASAQNPEVKEKPPLYTYIATWQVPRAHWGEMPKSEEATRPVLEKALADGTIVAYANDENLLHQADGYTHGDWWSAMSMAGLLKILDQLSAAGSRSTPVLETATRHEDEIVVSRFYNWHSGPYKNGVLQAAQYTLKESAPDNAVDLLSKNLVVPLLEKLLADGTLVEYEIDTQAIHTDSPGQFSIVWIAANPEAVDKVSSAIQAALRAQPLGEPAFASMVDFSKHRDELWQSTGVFK